MITEGVEVEAVAEAEVGERPTKRLFFGAVLAAFMSDEEVSSTWEKEEEQTSSIDHTQLVAKLSSTRTLCQ